MRLDKFLVHTGFGSRKEAKKYIKDKRIQINGKIAIKPDMNINEIEDKIEIDDEVIHYQEFYYLMMNKPAGYISATEDQYDHTVLDLISGYEHIELFPVGRLDKDTEGLLILSNDGKLSHKLLSPKSHVDKEYEVICRDSISDENLLKLETPLDLGDFTTMPASALRIDEKTIRLVIHEGKFHQVKRMIEKIGNEVLYLKRVRMGNLYLDESLKKGEYRELTNREIELLKEKNNNED